jgi:hypothetical protein
MRDCFPSNTNHKPCIVSQALQNIPEKFEHTNSSMEETLQQWSKIFPKQPIDTPYGHPKGATEHAKVQKLELELGNITIQRDQLLEKLGLLQEQHLRELSERSHGEQELIKGSIQKLQIQLTEEKLQKDLLQEKLVLIEEQHSTKIKSLQNAKQQPTVTEPGESSTKQDAPLQQEASIQPVNSLPAIQVALVQKHNWNRSTGAKPPPSPNTGPATFEELSPSFGKSPSTNFRSRQREMNFKPNWNNKREKEALQAQMNLNGNYRPYKGITPRQRNRIGTLLQRFKNKHNNSNRNINFYRPNTHKPRNEVAATSTHKLGKLLKLPEHILKTIKLNTSSCKHSAPQPYININTL